MPKWRAWLLVVAALAGSVVAVLAMASPAQADPTCQSGGYYVVYARGATAPLFSDAQKAFLSHIHYLLPNAAGAELGNLDGDVSENTSDSSKNKPDDSNEYPARGVNDNYSGSVTIGVNELVTHLNDRYSRPACASETLILAGYSEGAEVVGTAMNRSDLSSSARSRIGYVALYGDPKFQEYDQIPIPPWVQGTNSHHHSSGAFHARQPYVPDWLIGRLGSWCDDGDGYCNDRWWDLGNHGSIYSSYWFQQSASIIVAMAKLKFYQQSHVPLNSLFTAQDIAAIQAELSKYSTLPFAVPFDPPPSPVPWSFETLEGTPTSVSTYNSNTGQTPSALMFNGQPYVFSYDPDHGRLRWANQRSSGWVFGTIDGNGGIANGAIGNNVGSSVSAVVYAGTIQLFYPDMTSGNLRHAWSSDGTNWRAETLDGDPGANSHFSSDLGYTPSATVYGSSLQVFAYDAGNGNLRHIWTGPGQPWQFETLDGDPGSVSHYNGNVGMEISGVVWNGVLHLFYYNATLGNLRHARAEADGWHFEDLNGDQGSIAGREGDIGHNPTAFVARGVLHVTFYNATEGTLLHMWSGTDQGWREENLVGNGSSTLPYVSNTGSSSTAVVINGVIQMFVYEPGGQNLIHIWDDGSGWKIENLDGKGGEPTGRLNAALGMDPAVIDIGGKPNVFYYGQGDGGLRHAWPE